MTLTLTTTTIAQSGPLLDRLLGLSELSWSDPNANLGFEYMLPAWAWTLIVLAAFGFACLCYRHLLGPRFLRIALAMVRTLTILLLAALLAGPTLVLPQENIEQDWLLVMLDRSASMNMRDVFDADTDNVISREQSMIEALQQQAAVFGDQGLGKDRRVVWLGFGGSAYEVNSPFSNAGLDAADAQATLIRTSIDQALRLPSGKPISSIVLITDGQTPQDTGQDLTQRLQQQGIPVFTIPLGAAQPPLDLAITQADGPLRAFVGDTAPVSVSIEQLGGDPIDPSQIVVTLTDEADGRVLDEATLDEAPPGEPLKLAGKSESVGVARWRVEVKHEPPAGTAPIRELVTDNNARVVEIDVIDRPIRVLYVDGYPRWEFRYLKNLLIREKSISASTYLISADRSFAQEGDIPITRMPNSAEEFDTYDVIILGDVPPSFFQTGQLTLMRDHVSVGGAGILWIGGQTYMPQQYAGSPLADLLPMRRPADVSRFGLASSSFHLQPTSAARSLNVLQLRGIDNSTDSETVWSTELPAIRWVQDLGTLKPTAEVLAELVSNEQSDQHVPGLVMLRYGAGQSLYIATDESWRWRYGRGDWYFQQHWVPLIRMLGRARVQADSDRVLFSVSHRAVTVRQPVVIELELADASLINRGLSQIEVTARSSSDPTGLPIDTLTLLPVSENESAGPNTIQRAGFRAVWRPSSVGNFMLSVSDPALADLGLVRALRVSATDDEASNPRADHARLNALAEQTNGAVIPLDDLNRLINLVPNRARITETDIREPLWDSILSLILLGTLLAMEWIVRRAIRLA